MAATLIREDKLTGSTEGPSRFSQILRQTGAHYGHRDIDMQLWTVDGTAGATYTADVGTDGQQQHPILAFDYQTADDLAFMRFMVPPDYKPGGELFLLCWFYANDSTATHKTAFDVGVRIVPTTSSTAASTDHTSNVVLDGTSTAVVADFAAYTDDTANEIKSFQLDLTNGGAQEYLPFDLVLVTLTHDTDKDSMAAAVNICHTALIWER